MHRILVLVRNGYLPKLWKFLAPARVKWSSGKTNVCGVDT